MKFTPVHTTTHLFDDMDMSEEDVFSCCDSQLAVLTQEQLEAWLPLFSTLTQDEEAADFCEFGSRTQAFQIEDKLLVIVSDSGGELAAGEFASFCDTINIPSQNIVDGLDCEGVDVADIYTGSMDDNMALLTLLHRLYN